MPSRTAEKSPVPALDSPAELHQRFAELQAKAGAQAMAVSIADLETGDEFHYHADRWFHAASTIKVAILVGVFGAVHRGELLPQSRVHVRNRFLSAFDGSPYRVRARSRRESRRPPGDRPHAARERALRRDDHDEQQSRDQPPARPRGAGRAAAHASTGSASTASTCAAGWRTRRRSRRGSTTASRRNGLVGLLRLIGEERAFSPALSRQMLDVLLGQQFNSGIPAGLPRGARVAHKTGEISTIAHDAGAGLSARPQAVRARRAHRMGALGDGPLGDDRRRVVHSPTPH